MLGVKKKKSHLCRSKDIKEPFENLKKSVEKKIQLKPLLEDQRCRSIS